MDTKALQVRMGLVEILKTAANPMQCDIVTIWKSKLIMHASLVQVALPTIWWTLEDLSCLKLINRKIN